MGVHIAVTFKPKLGLNFRNGSAFAYKLERALHGASLHSDVLDVVD